MSNSPTFPPVEQLNGLHKAAQSTHDELELLPSDESSALVAGASYPKDAAKPFSSMDAPTVERIFTSPILNPIAAAFCEASTDGLPTRDRVLSCLTKSLNGHSDSKLVMMIGGQIFDLAQKEKSKEKPLAALKELRQLREAELKGPVFGLNHIGNGQRYAAAYGANMRFCAVRQCWLVFSGGRWQIDEKGEARAKAKAVVCSVSAEAARETDDDRRSRLLKHAVALDRHVTRETMLKDAASEPGMMVAPEEFDTAPHLFNLANGTLNLKSFELQPHNASDLLTHFSPVAFTPGADCPTWRRCMARWMPDEDTRDYCQDTFGLSLSGTVFEAFFNFLFGDGDNGKSTFLRILELLMGSYGHKTQAETIMQARDQRKPGAPAPELLALKGARLVTVHEIDSKHKLNATLIKDMTGSDTVTARGLFDKRPTTFEPQFTLWMFGNGKPQIPDTSGGMWRRVRLINFGQPIPKSERDPQLSQKLRAELPGILNWALEGLRRVNERSLIVPDSITAATEAYRAEQDPLADFFADCCVIGPKFKVKNSELWAAWCAWCQQTSDKEGSQRSLGIELTRRKFEAYSDGKERGRKGIGLKSLTELTELTENPNKSLA